MGEDDRLSSFSLEHANAEVMQLTQILSAFAELTRVSKRQHEDLLRSLSELTGHVKAKYGGHSKAMQPLKVDPSASFTSDTEIAQRGLSQSASVVSLHMQLAQERKQAELKEIHRIFKRDAQFSKFTEEQKEIQDLSELEIGLVDYCRNVARYILTSKCIVNDREYAVFENVMGLIIFANAILVGMESNWTLRHMNHPDNHDINFDLSTFNTLEIIFLGIYYMEIILRFISGGLKALSNLLVIFDITLVVVGTIGAIYFAIVGYDENSSVDDETSVLLMSVHIIFVLRVFRLLRLLRALRLIYYFEVLWKMVRDLLSSVPAVLSAIALITLTLYIAACFGVELIAKDTFLRSLPETADIIDEYFSSIDTVMVTFVQFVTVDSVSSIYWPLVKNRRYLFFYFGLVIVVVSIVLMNLVTANLVETAIARSKRDEEMEKQKEKLNKLESQFGEKKEVEYNLEYVKEKSGKKQVEVNLGNEKNVQHSIPVMTIEIKKKQKRNEEHEQLENSIETNNDIELEPTLELWVKEEDVTGETEHKKPFVPQEPKTLEGVKLWKSQPQNQTSDKKCPKCEKVFLRKSSMMRH